MSEEPTCGKGLAQHAELPLLVGELMGSVAANLSAHIVGLVSGDENSRHEKHVYEHLVRRLREAETLLHAIGTEMAAQRDMPIGDHDLQALSSGEAIDALERMTRVEAQFVARVHEALTEHQAMLATLGVLRRSGPLHRTRGSRR